VAEQVAALTGGRMADAVINVTAFAPGALQQAVELAKLGGTIVVAGEAHAPAAGFEPDLLFLKELTIKGVRGRTAREMKKAISLLEARSRRRSRRSAARARRGRSTCRCCPASGEPPGRAKQPSNHARKRLVPHLLCCPVRRGARWTAHPRQ
jgi:hypothetical protein